MKTTITVEHVCIEVTHSFDDFTFQLERSLGILMPAALPALGAIPASMAGYLQSTFDENNLILFNILAPDDLSTNEHNKKIKQYQIGNPQIMQRMAAMVAGTGLYTPIHLLVYETPDGKVMVEYDRPSSLFAQFNHAEILLNAITLESNLVQLIHQADKG